MEINLKKSSISRSTEEKRILSKALKKSGDQPSQTANHTKLPSFKEGQQVRGQILDLRYNEVRILLEPDKQVITAKLSGSVPLAIGDEARFVVTEENGQQLSLKYLPDNANASATTILKALTASGLPLTDRNKAIVEALLSHRLPIDKQTLTLLSKAALINKNASPLSIVLMYKNKIPLTAANIKQYEAYQNGSGQLMQDIQRITFGITDLLNATASSAFSDNRLKEALNINDRLLHILIGSEQDSSISSSEALDRNTLPLTALDNVETGTQGITEHLLTGNTPLEQQSELTLGSLPLKEGISLISQLYPEAAELLHDPGFIHQPVSLKALDAFSPELSMLLKSYIENSNDDSTLSAILNESSKTGFLQQISSIPISVAFRNKLVDGTATIQDFLSLLREELPRMDAVQAKALLSAPEYAKLMKHAFQSRWTITPDKLTEKGSLSELYHRLEEDMIRLRAITAVAENTRESLPLEEPVKNMQDNLQFIRNLNELFSFLQLPVQFKDQNVNSELYVFTRKKNLQEKKNLSVLLHLDMPNLGPINIHIQMEHNLVHTRFYLEDSTAISILETQLPTLTQALKDKGYHLTSDIIRSYQKPDFTRDLIEQATSEGEESTPVRYTFDIRT
jgi:hypothetical protein